MEAWSNHPNVESNLHSFGSKQNRWDNGAERASPDWWPRPPHACYLYVEGSWAGDHLEQVVPHHVLAGGQRGDGFSELPLNQPKHRADREADWPLLALLHFVDLLQWDGSQRLPLLRRRRRESTYQKQTETRDLVTMGRVIFSVCVWFHLNFVRKKPLFKSLLWSVEWTKRQSSHSDWKRDSKSDV